MPIEIRQLIISATIQNDKDGAGKPAAGASGGGSAAPPPVDSDQIVQACVEQVLDILRRKQER